MRVIIAPAKQMIVNVEAVETTGTPAFLPKTRKLKAFLQTLTYEEAKKMWACNDKLASQNYERVQEMNLEKRLTPAILAYDGIAYKYMAPNVFENGEFSYVQEHLRILSGFYGVLKPMDGVVPYRLEMQAKLGPKGKEALGFANLYDFWADDLYQETMDESGVLINLASKEYSKCIEKYLKPEDTCITCVFGELVSGKIVQKGVYAKMARGEMVRFMAEHHVEAPEEIKAFDRLDFGFSPENSDEKTYVWLRKNDK